MTLDSHSDSNICDVRIVRTTPSVAHDEIFAHRKCYMGISLDNPVFSGESLKRLILWAVDNFDTCLVVVGDYLRRYNETLISGLEGEQARDAAIASGDDFIAQNAELFASLPEDKVTLIRWRQCLEDDGYIQARGVLDKLYDNDEVFRAAIQRDAFTFVKRQKKNNLSFAVDDEQAIQLCSQYLLEEISVFSSLSQQGWKVELYPGAELDVLVDVAAGKFGQMPPGLTDRINVELQSSINRTM